MAADPDGAGLLAPEVSAVGRDFDDAPIALIGLGAGLELLRANRAWQRIASAVPAPARWLEVFDPVSQARVRTELHRLAPGAPCVVSVRGVDGRRQFELRASLREDRDSGAGRFCVAVLDVTDQAEREAMLAFDATHDDLTGLLNRAALFPVVEQALARFRRKHDTMAVLFIDLDNFKQVNDRFGHAAGDDVLRTFASRLRRAAREEDTVARIGGDEFAVFCEGLATREEAVHIAERLITATAAPFEGEAADTEITVTIGIAYAGDDSDSPRSLLENADVAMYQAKGVRVAGARSTSEPGLAGAPGSEAVVRRLQAIDADVTSEWRLAVSSGAETLRWDLVSKHVRAAIATVRGATRI